MQSPFAPYIRHGWALVPLSPGDKRPKHRGWNQREMVLTTEADIHGVESAGLAHAYSGTCCLDIDDVEAACRYMAEYGIDLQACLTAPDAVQITSGRPNRAKLIYTLPEPLTSYKVNVRCPDDSGTYNILDFRCATRDGLTVQDVLPPTVHPDTQRPYEWLYDELITDWSTPPELPADLHEFWLTQLREESTEPPEASKDYSVEELRAMLEAIDPDVDYGQWINVGMALHDASDGSEAGLALWDEWSAQGAKYRGYRDLLSHWRSFRGSGVTADYLLMFQTADPEQFDEVTDEGPLPERKKFQPEHVHQWVKRPPPKWLIHQFLPDSHMAMIYGKPQAGKSFLALDIALTVAAGEQWWGRETENGPVLWVAAEAEGSVRNRALAYAQHHALSLESTDFWIIGDTPALNNVEQVQELAKGARPLQPSIIFIDTLIAASGGANENSGEDMATIFAACRTLHKTTGALIVLIHHLGKDQTKGARGWSGIEGEMQTMIEVTHDESTGERHARMHKQRDGEAGDVYPFQLTPVHLPPYDGVPQVSCVVEPMEGVTMFQPSYHHGWMIAGIGAFAEAGSATMPIADWTEKLNNLDESDGIPEQMARDLEQLGDLLYDGNGTITLVDNDYT